MNESRGPYMGLRKELLADQIINLKSSLEEMDKEHKQLQYECDCLELSNEKLKKALKAVLEVIYE